MNLDDMDLELLDLLALNDWETQESEDIKEGERLIRSIEEYGIREFTNLHELDDEGNLITNEKGDLVRESY